MIGKTISHYNILEKLGKGGMGVVYKAEDTKLKRTVALKFLSPELIRDPEAKERFIQEAQAAAALDHPNICTIHEIDEAKGQSFIAMAYIRGQSLKEKVTQGPLKIDEALDITIQVGKGLREAHEKGIVHRDIKPANIMLTEKGQAKIMDFGLAKLTWGADLTKTATIMGTVAYMSPEQARGDKVDHRTDIWSLGAMLYEMLTGERPFKSKYDQAALYSILKENPESLIKLRKDIPTKLEHVVLKCMEKAPLARYRDMHPLITDLISIAKISKSTSYPIKSEEERTAPSIAVLPFINMSADPEQEYFCDGMAEELINSLTKIKDLRVVARTSAFSFKGEKLDVREIGKRLNVDSVLEGSVRKAGNKLRITAQLINVADGYHLWSERYDRELEDIFTIQDEISLAIVNSLKVKLLGNEKAAILRRYTDDLEAYNFYLKGIYFLRMYSPGGFKKAIEHFEQSLQKDPNYALAYSGLAEVFYVISYWGSVTPNEACPKAKAFAKKALEIDDSVAEAHAALGFINTFYDWNWKEGEQELKKALQLNPNSAINHLSYSWFLSLTERHEEAIIEAKHAQGLDPLSSVINAHVGFAFFLGSQYDNAIEELKLAITMDPNFYLSHYYLNMAYRGKSMIEEAIAENEKAVDLSGGNPLPSMILASGYFEYGKKAKGEKLFKILKQRSKHEYMPPLGFFYIHQARGEQDQADEWLEQAFKEHDSFLPWCIIWPIERYRIPDEPKFRALLKNSGLEK